MNPVLTRYHQPENPDHDQESHGNWATGDVTDSDSFKAWFSGSKIVDESGKPLVLYHGTNVDFDRFDRGFLSKTGAAGERLGFFFTDNPDEASLWATFKERGNPNVIPAYVRMKSPLVIDLKGTESLAIATQSLEKRNLSKYDGIILRNAKDSHGISTQYIVFKPTQIKSKFARKFNPKDPRISYENRDGKPRAYIDKTRLSQYHG